MEIKNYYNLHKGERCFIIGTGPSMNNYKISTIRSLKDEFTIGLNFIHRWKSLYTANLFPTHIMVGEQNLNWGEIENYWRDYPNTKLVYATPQPECIPDPWLPIRIERHSNMQAGGFRGFEITDIDEGKGLIDGCGSVALMAVQFACYLGCNPIYLLGCDAGRKGHCYWEPENGQDRGNQIGFQNAALTALKVMESRSTTLIDLCKNGDLPLPKGELEGVL